MNIYRLYPGNDAFQISDGKKQNVFLPHLDVIADDEAAAIRGAEIVMPGFNNEACINTLNYVELIGKH